MQHGLSIAYMIYASIRSPVCGWRLNYWLSRLGAATVACGLSYIEPSSLPHVSAISFPILTDDHHTHLFQTEPTLLLPARRGQLLADSLLFHVVTY